MQFFLDLLINLLKSEALLFWVQLSTCSLKLLLLVFLVNKGLRSKQFKWPLIYLIGALSAGAIVDLAWMLKLLRSQYLPLFDYRCVLFVIRLSWASSIIQFLSLGFFIDSLAEKKYKIAKRQVFLGLLTLIFTIYFIVIAFYYFNIVELTCRPWHELTMMGFSSVYLKFLIVFPSIYLTVRKLQQFDYPKILKKQLLILIKYLMIPVFIAEIIEGFFIQIPLNIIVTTNISAPLLTVAYFFTVRTIMGLRFLNFQNHVQSHQKFNFIDDFKNLLEQLSHTSSNNELGHITQTFFKDAFGIIQTRANIYFRRVESGADELSREISPVETIVENFISSHKQDLCKIGDRLRKDKILIYDEIEFSNFYEEQNSNQELLSFLDHLNADIFLPIYDRHALIAYIIVEREARVNQFYSDVERDEMLVFASYLGNVINLLQHRSLEAIVEREKNMREELYIKHQEINKFKESIRSFMRDNKQRKIGIVFYKNRRFIIGNKDAKELIRVNVNAADGHPVTKALKLVAHQVEEYKSAQTTLSKDYEGNQLVISGIPNLEQNNVILTITYPEVSDILKSHMDQLNNPSEWDYLLYLETTKSGQLINQLVPGNGSHLLNFKIELLKLALSKKALLLEMSHEDLSATVEILHHISLKEELHIMNLKGPVTDADIAIKLFGINQIFQQVKRRPLLEKLDNVGTLCINNIHFLDLATQDYLAEYIKYGYYHIYKSEQVVYSNVRIICSTNQNLQTLIQEGKFSRALFAELRKTIISLPSLLNLPEPELNELAQGFSEQAIASPAFKNLLELTPRERQKLLKSKPASLHEFKERIQHLLVAKSKKNNIYQETHFDPAYNISDPELTEAARLGKKALKDPKIMVMLWNKFKSQNKIATLLGVNRSSVNRRCKEYNLC